MNFVNELNGTIWMLSGALVPNLSVVLQLTPVGFSRVNSEASTVSGSVSRDAVNKVPTSVGEK